MAQKSSGAIMVVDGGISAMVACFCGAGIDDVCIVSLFMSSGFWWCF